jgi:hypothetical protein
MSTNANNNGGCLFALINALFGKGKTDAPLPYRVRDDFLSPAESSFYRVLLLVCGEQYRVFPKVRLVDILFVQKGVEKWQSHHNRISNRHVDFLLCHPQTLRPALAVELDDSSHNRSDRKERDAFFDQAFKAAVLPMLHVPAKNTYDVQQLRTLLSTGLAEVARPSAGTTTPGSSSPERPICPKCGIPLIVKRNDKTGQPFYACNNFPKCRETRSI